jgi:hypothetical protein
MYLSDDIQVLLFKNNTLILYYIAEEISSGRKRKNKESTAGWDKIG